jgi:hypothetical protein
MANKVINIKIIELLRICFNLNMYLCALIIKIKL